MMKEYVDLVAAGSVYKFISVYSVRQETTCLSEEPGVE